MFLLKLAAIVERRSEEDPQASESGQTAQVRRCIYLCMNVFVVSI